MKKNNTSSRLNVPMPRLTFRLSKAALGFILASVLLAGVLVVSTMQNIDREEMMMENLLAQKGETIIRSVEAGVRTTMMSNISGENLLAILDTERNRENDIVYIKIVDANGNIVVETGHSELSDPKILKQARRVEKSEIIHDTARGIFQVARPFEPISTGSGVHMMQRSERWQQMTISVGLLTREFDIARRHDVHHNQFMAVLIFLVGSAGLYFLLLYQGMRVARTTLENMKLYTANVIESIPAGLLTLDAANTIVSTNRKAEEILGMSFGDMQGRAIREVFPDCPLPGFRIESELLDVDSVCIRPDGNNVPIRFSVSQLLDQSGEALGTVLILRDMSLMKNMEQQLERSRRMAALGTMAAGIAHEIRNPLGTLKGFAQFFGAQAGENDKSRRYAALMVSEVDRLNQTISALLQFARPREPQIENVNLDTLIMKTVALMEAECKHHDLILHCSSNPTIVVAADPDLLLQVLMNLLKNSISATPPHGEISLNVICEEHGVVISVHDTGKGMAQEEREQIFDPFFTTKKTGTGLGLTVSHQIIEQHNGRFEVISEPGKGTEIRIILPFIQKRT